MSESVYRDDMSTTIMLDEKLIAKVKVTFRGKNEGKG